MLVSDGYDAMACDNYGLENGQQACGVWEAPGVWKQLYSGDPVDAKFAEAQLHWLCQFSAASPLLVQYSVCCVGFVFDCHSNCLLRMAAAATTDCDQLLAWRPPLERLGGVADWQLH